MSRSLFILCLLLVFIFAPARPALATDTVVGTGTPESCTEAAFDSALAIVQGSGSGTITFNCGGAATIVFTGQKLITNGVTIQGGGLITLSGGDTTGLFYVTNTGALSIQSMTLENGYGHDGVAIHNEGAVWLTDSTIRASRSAFQGGAIWSSGNLSILGSRILNNSVVPFI